MAEERRRAWKEIDQEFEPLIQAKEKEVREAIETKKPPELIAAIKEERDRLNQEKVVLKRTVLAELPGEVLGAPFAMQSLQNSGSYLVALAAQGTNV